MGKPIIKIKLSLYVLTIFLSSAMLCIYCFYILNKPPENIDKDLRLLLNNAVYKVEKNDFTQIEQYDYAIYDLEGNVINSNLSKFPKGIKIDLRALSGANITNNRNSLTYRAPYLKDNKQIGSIEIMVSKNSLQNTDLFYYIPIIILLLFIVFILHKLISTMKKDILSPIDEIHNVTKNLLKGDLAQRVYYDYDGEIGTLCHDFEALRLDLCYSVENEKKLKEKEKLLLACISHDLRTPISAISGYVEGIHNGIVKDDWKIKEYTTIILSKIAMLNGLINDILEHSKAQLNQFSITLTECYSKAFFEDIILENKKDALNKHINFTYNDIPNVLINIDKKRIAQVIQNLVSNSIKFSKLSGSIDVEFSIQDNMLLVSVKDDGIGIDAKDQPLIFNEFYRGEKARTLNVQGSGLGLNISKYIIEKHGGFIECDSILNYGTTITFSLPLL